MMASEQMEVTIPALMPRRMTARRLEEAGIWHGAGQSEEAFARYGATVEAGCRPALMMTYGGLNGSAEKWGERISRILQKVGTEHTVLQLGLSMTVDGQPEKRYEHEVARGDHDEKLEAWARVLAGALGGVRRRIFVRLGYEFNGHWNGYEPETFQAAWHRVAGRLREALGDRLALVWCWSPDDLSRPFMDFYPGDAVVDWWGVDLFDAEHFSLIETERFIMEATVRGYPVMVGESTPRRVGVLKGPESWQRWFHPCVHWLARQPCVKAFCYINWDWAAYPQWADWGDCRLESNPWVAEHWRRFLADPQWIHDRG